MKKIALYAEKSLIDNDSIDLEARDGNRLSRDYAGIMTKYGYVINNDYGIAVVAVNDILTSEAGWRGIDYKNLAVIIEQLEKNDEVKAIVLDINSGGGDVNGLFDFTEYIQSVEKPIYTYTSGNLASAAYTIAAATDGIYATESALIGSVGVFMSFIDDSGYLSKNGIKEITFYGKNSDKKNLDPESKEGKEVYQAEIDELEQMLISNVAKYRGVSSDKVLEDFGHGLMFHGNEALERGMIDGIVSTFDDFMDIVNNADSTADGGDFMAKETENKVLANSVEAIDPELLAKIKADAKAEALAENEGKQTEAVNEAVNAERARVAELDRYASLPNAEISAMAEKAKADGTTVAEFKEKFSAKAFEIISKGEAQTEGQKALADEAKESAELDTGSTPEKTEDKGSVSAVEQGKKLAERTNARIKK